MFLQACLNGTRAPGHHERLPLTPDDDVDIPTQTHPDIVTKRYHRTR